MSTFKLKVNKKGYSVGITEFNFSIKKLLNYLIKEEGVEKVTLYNTTDYSQTEPLLTINSDFKIVK
jgi:hypothetical protein